VFNRRVSGLIPIFFAVALIASLFSANTGGIHVARAATITVNTLTDVTNGNCTTTCTLRDALATANNGDTIDLSMTGTITLVGSGLTVRTDITIQGLGAASLTVSGANAYKVITVNSGVTATIAGLTVANGKNTSYTTNGAGIDNEGTLTINNAVISGNTTSGCYGAGIYNNGTLTIDNTTINSNSVGTCNGGGIYNAGNLTVNYSIISDNIAGAGAGISNSSATGAAVTASINHSVIADNTASIGGAGIDNASNATVLVNSSTIANNTCSNSGEGGCGLRNTGTMTIGNSTIANNSILAIGSNNGYGGGIWNYVGTLTITNSTISGNSAPSDAGINNNSQYGGAILNLGSTIVAGNILTGGGDTSPDINGAINSLGNNLVGNGTGASGYVSSDQVGTGGSPINAWLDPLANNGGPTQTMALEPGSPAIGKGNCSTLSGVSPVTMDQRGIARKSPCDVGAYETFAFSPTSLPSGIVGSLYNQAISASGGIGANTFSVTSGTLPYGLNLSSDGTLSGTPTAGGTFNFTVTATDVNGDTSAYEYSILIVGPTVTPTNTNTPTATFTSTATPTFTNTPTSTNTPTAISSATNTATPTNTFTNTATNTPIPPRIDSIGVFRSGTFYLRLHNSTGNAEITAAFNPATKPYPLVGDWTGAGFDTIGVLDQNNGLFSLRNSDTSGTPDEQLVLGNSNDIPLGGRWSGNATHFGVGVFRPSNGLIYLKNNLTTGFADDTMVLGIPGDAGLAGDWNGKGYDSPGVYRPSNVTFYLSNQICNCSVFGDYAFQYGVAGDAPVAGDWIGQGHDGVGLFRQSNGFTYLRNALTTGFADIAFTYGIAGDIPVAGHWQLIYPPKPNPGSALVSPTALPIRNGTGLPGD
jgi:CSLREA domain-containing protein